MHARVKFHHNLLNLYPPSKYRETHPEFYPSDGIVDTLKQVVGKTPKKSFHWQPCFSAPGILEHAVKNISEYFDEHPGEDYYSLGMNDSGTFCECFSNNKQETSKNYLGFDDCSYSYFRWANAVAAEVLKTYPMPLPTSQEALSRPRLDTASRIC